MPCMNQPQPSQCLLNRYGKTLKGESAKGEKARTRLGSRLFPQSMPAIHKALLKSRLATDNYHRTPFPVLLADLNTGALNNR